MWNSTGKSQVVESRDNVLDSVNSNFKEKKTKQQQQQQFQLDNGNSIVHNNNILSGGPADKPQLPAEPQTQKSFYEEVYREGRRENSNYVEYLTSRQNGLATNEDNNVLPWYFSNGERYPKTAVRNRKTKRRVARLLPSEDLHSDRITNQLMFVPPNYEQMKTESRNKVILLFNGLSQWNVKGGRDLFVNNKCPVDTCTLTDNREMASKADMLLYKDHYINAGVTRSMYQIYMIYFLECPFHTQNMPFPDVFNWTATYRSDSDIVAPYEKWEYFDPRVKQLEQDRNYSHNKTKKVAWFVSNCNARNNRLQYANELSKYIEVDIYGYCGSFHCPRTQSSKCFEILDTDYKFYLAFENSNCKDYITEKFFMNALNRNVLPIVMGAPPEDYAAVAPYKSYIHVDEFESPKELAEYLHLLDKNEELYNAYFKWKGTGEFINTYFWCRVCAMLHDTDTIGRPSKWYEDINDWWNGPGVCTKGSWRAPDARKAIVEEEDEE